MSGENIKHHCGVFGIFNHPEAAKITHLGLFALQHRGEEAAGVCTSDGDKLYLHKKQGHVGELFDADPGETISHPLPHLCGSASQETPGEINPAPFRSSTLLHSSIRNLQYSPQHSSSLILARRFLHHHPSASNPSPVPP